MSTRRSFLRTLFGGVVAAPIVTKANHLCSGLTPIQPEGPFYPENTHQEDDTDLTYLQGNKSRKAKGEVIVVRGQVTDLDCVPVEGAIVEIWQACASGRYNHSQDPNPAPLDPNFQYWGRAITDANGSYQFRTIRPGAYPADENWTRPPHIHFKVHKLGYMELITQMYFQSESLNLADRILQRLTPDQQKEVIIGLSPGDGGVPTGVFNMRLERA